MKYNKYLNNTPKVSEIGLGAWQLGENSGWKNVSEKEAINLVEKALDLGVNFFDTAPNYGLGSGEERLGKALKNVDRDKIVVNTKFGHSNTGETNYSSSVIRDSVEGSLRRLKLDYVDSVIIHNPPMHYLDGNKNDHYEILEKLVNEGKIKAYGASLDTYDEMKLLMETTNSKVIEAFFNILHQDSARAFSMAKEKNVAIIAKIPLDSGWLGGKYSADTVFKDVRDRWTEEDKAIRSKLVEKVKEIIGVNNNLAQHAIAFCLANDEISTVIPGNINIEQLKSNISSADLTLPSEMRKKLKEFYLKEVKDLNIPW